MADEERLQGAQGVSDRLPTAGFWSRVNVIEAALQDGKTKGRG